MRQTNNHVKEHGKGIDRMRRELEANGATAPTFHSDDFILKVIVTKVTENVDRITEKLPETPNRVTEKTSKVDRKLEKVTENASKLGETLTENRLDILRLIIEDPYISKTDLAKAIGISYTSISRNIEAMRDKYLRRIGPDKGGFWEIIE